MPQQLWALGYLYQPKSTPLTGSGVAHCPCILEHRQQSGHKGPLSAKITSKRGGKTTPKTGKGVEVLPSRACHGQQSGHQGHMLAKLTSSRGGKASVQALQCTFDSMVKIFGAGGPNSMILCRKGNLTKKAVAISSTSNVMLLFGPAMHARLDVEDL